MKTRLIDGFLYLCIALSLVSIFMSFMEERELKSRQVSDETMKMLRKTIRDGAEAAAELSKSVE